MSSLQRQETHASGAGPEGSSGASGSPQQEGAAPRILMVSMWYPPSPGGLARQAHLLTRTLAALGTPVEVVTMYEAGIRGLEQRDGVPVHRLPALEGGGNRRRALPWLLPLALFLIDRRRRFDVIHVHQALHAAALCRWIGRALGKKCVVKVAGSGAAGNVAVLKRWRWSGSLALRQIRKADAIVSLSQEMTHELVANGFARVKIVQLTNGVDLARFREASPAPGLERSVIVPARLAKEKGLDLLLRAWAQVHPRQPGWELLFLGEGPERVALAALAEELGVADSIRFLGEIPNVAPYLVGNRVFALPSRPGEGMSNAILEAMAAGCACVVSNIPANAQLVDHERTGLLFETEDPGDLAAQLGRLLEDGGLRRRLGEAAAAGAAAYSIHAVARHYRELYRQLLAGEPLHDAQEAAQAPGELSRS